MRRSLRLAVVLTLCAAGWAGAAELDQFGRSHIWRGEMVRHTVIDFAASWCGPCWKTLPKLQALADSHPELRVLVVSVDDEKNGRDRLVEGLELRLPVLWDEDYAIAEYYQPEAMPATYLLSPEGGILYHHEGSSEKDWETFVALVERLRLQEMGGDRSATEAAPRDEEGRP